jgi:UDP-glucose 4-epimerase
MKKILITGGAGYIGLKLAKHLLDSNYQVVVVDDLSTGSKKYLPREVKFYRENICSKKFVKILEKERPSMIYHLAASKDVNSSLVDPMGFARINILGSINVISSAIKLGIKDFVFTSTAGVYGDGKKGKLQKESDPINPSSPYAWSKLAIEQYIDYANKNFGFRGIIVRFANVYGPGFSHQKSVVDIFIGKVLKGEPITLFGTGRQTRDFVNVDDLVDVCAKLAENKDHLKEQTPIFNVSTGKESSVIDVIDQIQKNTGVHVKTIHKREMFSGQKRSILSPHKIKKQLDWRANISLERGIADSIRNYSTQNYEN